ncbi:hypothetical protein AX17_003132 [Amanita inopinata Kibby_2008]|nr:hypothetical protein AX17_003132 [Amanita inopinata Kibby_2008]
MDLDKFDEIDVSVSSRYGDARLTVQQALVTFDDLWYGLTYRRARWMDLLGDYAGNELFILDGESLVQSVLDNPLLALGKDDCSFQILHAYFLLEQAILEFKKRSANFEIVFWQAYRHATIKTGYNDFIAASRSLARIMLYKHLLKIDGISVHVFNDFDDREWMRYRVLKNPMFVMANDGGAYDNTEDLDVDTAGHILTRRLFLFRLLTNGISFARLNGAEYREFKILSFVNEHNSDRDWKKLLPKYFWKAASDAGKQADSIDLPFSKIGPVPGAVEERSSASVLLDVARAIVVSCSDCGFFYQLLFAFLLHCTMLPRIAVGTRAQVKQQIDASLSKLLRDDFLPKVFLSLAELSTGLQGCVDIDIRIFISMLSFLSSHSREQVSTLVPKSDYEALSAIWLQFGYPSVDFSVFASHFSLKAATAPRRNTVHIKSLLPFENEVFDEELKAVKVTVKEVDSKEVFSAKYFNFGQGVPFSDGKHWHNQKSILPRNPGGARPKKLGFYARRRELKRKQVFMLRLQDQAATLTGASGAVLQQMVIAPVGAHKNSHRSSSAHVVTNSKKKEPKLSSADKLRLQIQAEKANKQENTTQTWWLQHLESMSSMYNSRKSAYLKNLFKNRRSEEPWIRMEMQLFQLNLEFLQWIDEVGHESDAIRNKYTVSIVRIIKDISRSNTLTPTTTKMLTAALRAIGFDDYIPSLVEKTEVAPDKKLSFKPLKLVSSRTKESYYPYMRIQEDPVIWQLRLFGEFMDRSMDSAPDPRVSFEPDAWQRKVLDGIDANQSLLVVAPTSAGKTFISFYAMEKVLRESDEGILVYVAPTKALVTQVAAEVYARFSKTVKEGSCWAIHTRDYRVHEPLNCQILVTVPEMLAIMLLSPSIARSWTSRIKWIVLDEIHCIGQQEGGAVWEQIILFAPCPIIGLSATIGSPEVFNNWLEAVQEAHGYKHAFIQHPHRYSHLRKFFYLLDKKRKSSEFPGLSDYQPTSSARFLHPISMLSFGAQSIPPDLALESRDALKLYEVLVQNDSHLDCDTEVLEPRRFFSQNKGRLLTQKDIIRYEDTLKSAISSLLATFDPTDSSSAFYNVRNGLNDPLLATVSPNAVPSTTVFLHNLIYLVADLHAKDELPAILFSFDRTACEVMLEYLLLTLEKAEAKWRRNNPEWQRKIEAWEAWRIKAKARERQTNRDTKFKRGDDQATAGGEQETSWESSFDPKAPSEQFSFANMRVYSKSDLQKEIADLSGVVQPWILRALKRGIAVHHSGMNKGYRALVESLFRLRFIRVLISTGTLALGINAPTKTSVFAGDSPYLTALMYRQCSGRAGRRGFDLLGNVVFCGLAMNRVQRLVLSKLPTLGGNFPLTSTLVLRLCNLLHGSENAPVAVKAVQTALSLPSISFGSEVGKHQLLHHLRFSIEYLRRCHLLDDKGQPMNLYALVAHLYYTEPSNLALVALMHSGVLHKICCQSSLTNAKYDYIHLMSHLFGRRYLSRVMMNSATISDLITRYPSMVVLPPLPEDIRNALSKHNQEILNIFTSYVFAYTREHNSRLGPDDRLPLSRIQYANSGNPSVNESPLNQHLAKTAIPVIARSAFAANSGHGDEFHSVRELAQTVRDGVYLNEQAIPSMSHLIGSGDEEHDLNAYLLDFYIHGQKASLVKANGIRPNDVWYFLEDFSLTLSLMKAALEQLFLKNAKMVYEKEKEDRLKAGKRGDSSGEDEDNFELDSGYGTLESGNWPDGDDEGEGGTAADSEQSYLISRPPGVSNADWKVYEVVSAAREEFFDKFKAMWA